MFAKEHGVLVIPEFDTPGHALSWGAALPGFLTHCPGKGNIGSEYGPIDPTNEAVYPLLKSLLTEVSFPAICLRAISLVRASEASVVKEPATRNAHLRAQKVP